MLTLLFLNSTCVAEPITILAFGDSLTQGYGLAPEKGFVPQMQTWLRQQGADVTVINAGVSGDTTAGGAARIGWSLTDEVDAAIVALGGNDMLRGIDPASAAANLEVILSQIETRDLPVLLVGAEATGNYGAKYKAQFDAIYPALAARHHTELFANFMQGLADLDDRALVMARYMQRDALHPNAQGVELIVARMGPAVLAMIQAQE